MGLLCTGIPASAKILKTRKPGEYGNYKEMNLTVGSGFELETDSEGSQYVFPFLVEYGATQALTLTLEPEYDVTTSADASTIRGVGETEMSATYEFLTERRNRPSLSAEGVVKLPTASSDSLGTGEYDYSLGGVISKEFVHFDLDSEVLYTFVGSPPGLQATNTLEISLAGEWHIHRRIDMEVEGVTSNGGGFHGQSSLSRNTALQEPEGRQYEGTIGMAEFIGQHLKLEEGVVFMSDGSWQFVSAWEWNFTEGE
jgi:hypothetical protein